MSATLRVPNFAPPVARSGEQRSSARTATAAGFRSALPWLLGSLVLALVPLVGQVHPLWVLLGCAGCAGWRLWIDRRGLPLPTRLRFVVFVPMALGVLAYYGKTRPTAPEMLSFLPALLSLKVLESRSHRDCVVVALLTFFMILSTFFYDQSLALSLYLSAVVAANTVALIRCHTGQRSPPLWPNIRLAFSLMAQATPLVVLLFIVFPRFEGNFLRQLTGATTGLTGMGDRLQPGSFTGLVQSNQPAFRATIASGSTVVPRNLYWRGLVLTVCESGLVWSAGEPKANSQSSRVEGMPVEQQITLYPHGERWLFALDRPFRATSGQMNPQLTPTGVLRSDTPIGVKTVYTAYSDLTPTNNAALDQDLRTYYSRAPADLSTRTLGLAGRWRHDATGPNGVVDELAIIHSARQFFQKGGFTYTLTPGLLPAKGALDHFLFESRRGFCEHYAAAFSTLMRAAGLPSRIVLGYQGGEYNGVWGNYYLVRQSDAHAWSEVWIEGRGWQREDPTAIVAPERVDFGADDYAMLAEEGALTGESRLERLNRLKSPGLWRRLERTGLLAWDGIDQQWNLVVLGYDKEHREDALDAVGLGGLGWIGDAVLTMSAIFTAGGLMIAMAGTVHRRHADQLDAVARLYAAFCRRVERATGLARTPSEGPQDYARRASTASPELAPEISAITDLYVTSRYAFSAPGAVAKAVESLRKSIRRFRG